MTLILDLELSILKMYLHAESEVLDQGIQNLEPK